MVRRAARVDENHPEIVKALRQVGCSVLSLAAIGKGAPDLAIGYKGRNVLLEIKRPKGKLNDQQEAFRAAWRGDLCVVRSVEEALLVLGIVA
jgi:Holliday junction resolvase